MTNCDIAPYTADFEFISMSLERGVGKEIPNGNIVSEMSNLAGTRCWSAG